MKNNKIFLIVLIIVGVGILFGHSFYHTAGMAKSENTTTAKIAPNTVEIKKYEFTPKKITVKKGTIVTWINYDLAPHTVTMDENGKEGPSSEIFGKGKKFSYTFSKSGTYKYHCEPHPYMKAEVVVTE